ncbi:thioredoxin domain-containing protein [Bifidobacterium sp. ESL0763]|uniref:DsbA family protein n=1 Tax=Bifidobacterium sp. ESL0763 TaxID=2983227 RepID=UPI0023F6533C|nr:thioredoxin domain-containing protein [Bifidobacterium sp. ESL0763]MDF7663089.1 thioredoxin domain-containing protein [Bifidobacterium sp. ESL0763]
MARHDNDYLSGAGSNTPFNFDAGQLLLQAHREQQKKERRQRRIVGFVGMVLVIALITVIGLVSYKSIHQRNVAQSVTVQQSYQDLQAVKLKPKYADAKGGILFSHLGYGKTEPNAPTLEIFTDPMCPGCAVLHQQMDETFRSMLDAGQVNLSIHPVTFLDGSSSDQYSTRASGAVAYIASNDPDPDHLLDFLTNIHSESFQPSENQDYRPVSDDQLKQQALSAGVPQNIADKAFDGEYKPWLQASAQYTLRRDELKNKSGEFAGKITTPLVLINGSMMDISAISDRGLTYKQAILQTIGLTNDGVGVEGVMPTLGAKDKPSYPKQTA